jgi:hypothetical protein
MERTNAELVAWSLQEQSPLVAVAAREVTVR